MDSEVTIPGFHCTECGKCCTEGASRLQATESDIRMWETAAPHVLEWVSGRDDGGGDLWVSPRTGRDTVRCPWIRKYPHQNRYYCRIYDHRPQVCRRYPTSAEHAVLTDCPGVSSGQDTGRNET